MRVYSYVNRLGDVCMFTLHGRRRKTIREVVHHGDGTISAWKPRDIGTWAAWHVGETRDDGIALAWMTGSA